MFPISDTARGKRFPIVNLTLIAITCYVFYLQITAPDFEQFISFYALIPAHISLQNPSTWYPFLTSIFLHGGWLHIISNMWFLYIFGDNVEADLGPIRYLLLYLAAGVVGGLAQYALAPTSGVPMLGASGAIAGALGAYFAFFPQNKIKTVILIFGFITIVNVSAYVMLGYWFVLQIISGATAMPGSSMDQGGVAFWAHVGGFVAGYLLSKVLRTRSDVLTGEIIPPR